VSPWTTGSLPQATLDGEYRALTHTVGANLGTKPSDTHGRGRIVLSGRSRTDVSNGSQLVHAGSVRIRTRRTGGSIPEKSPARRTKGDTRVLVASDHD